MVDESETIAKFKPDLMSSLLKQYFTEPNAKIQKDAVKAVALLTELLVKEAVQRSVSMAETQGSCELDVDHLAAILPQLLLDFS